MGRLQTTHLLKQDPGVILTRPARIDAVTLDDFGATGLVLQVIQLARLGDRRAANALVSSRLDSAVVDVRRLPADTALA